MRMTRFVRIQLIVFTIVSLVAALIVALAYLRLPALFFGVGRYTVTVELPEAGGLYSSANVTYRGSEVGKVTDVRLADNGVDAVLSLHSDVPIPSDLDAQVHSESAVGEQYVALLPRNGTSAPLKDGDTIPQSRTSVQPPINSLLDAANRGLQAIPRDNLKTVVDEGYTAFGGLGPDIGRLVRGATQVASGARKDQDALTTLIDQSKPVLDSQSDTADDVQAWAAHLATITHQLQTQDNAVAGVIDKGAPAADEVRQLLDRVQPTLPLVLANLVSVGQVALAYQPSIEQLLVLLPQGVNALQGVLVANLGTKAPYKGAYLSFNTNINVPPVCNTGFLPPQQQRTANFEDAPDRPAGEMYCRVPQDSMWDVRGARNYPCMTVPGKRAPTVKMCESNEQYVPLNDGLNWKGDPNATLSGQPVPQLPSGTPPAPDAPPGPAPPPVAAVHYDPATGKYIGPDGKVYTQTDLAQSAPKEPTWQSMLTPPTGN